MFCVCVGRTGLPSVRSGRLLCLCTVGMRAGCSGSVAQNTSVDYLNLYHLDWNTPQKEGAFTNRGNAISGEAPLLGGGRRR